MIFECLLRHVIVFTIFSFSYVHTCSRLTKLGGGPSAEPKVGLFFDPLTLSIISSDFGYNFLGPKQKIFLNIFLH